MNAVPEPAKDAVLRLMRKYSPPSRPSGPVLSPEIVAAASRGWRLHPLRPNDKLPHLKEWQHRATSVREEIEVWAREYPGCNWGAVCGPESGFFAVDVDVPAAMQRLEDEHGPIPEGLCNVTSRGYQLLYAWPEDDVRAATGCPCDGIDVRGRNSYIVIPPSVHPSGHVYRYSDDSLPIPACPAWLLGLLLNRSQAGAPARQRAPAVGTVGGEPIAKGKRTPHLVSLAGTMHKRNMDHEAIEAALLRENEAKCVPPLPEQKVRAIAKDIPARYPNAQKEEPSDTASGPDIVCLADIAAKDVDWLWKLYLAFGMLAMLSGDPGSGKTFIALAICAGYTVGRTPDGEQCAPINVLYMSVENAAGEVIRPRFDSLGGDAKRFFLLRGTTWEQEGETVQGSITLADISNIEKAIVATGALLLVIDPIQSYLGANVDLHRSNETRPILDGLAKLAEKYGCAILILRHLSKQSGGKAIHRGLGSIDLTGAVRSEMLAGSLPDDPESRAMVHIKTNIGAYGPSLGYSIDADGKFSWTGRSEITAGQMLAAPEGPERGAKQRAKEWLASLLKSGSKAYTTILELAKEEGFTEKTLRRAKTALNIRSRKAGMNAGWIWWLPDNDPGSEIVQ